MHVERMTSTISIQDGDLALSPAQIEKLVALVIARLEDRAREAQRSCAATRLSRQASMPLEPGA
jgi:hypothetical protein